MLEALKDDQEDEEIVHAERGLNGVAGHEFQSRLAAFGKVDPYGKARRGQHKHAGPEPRNGLRTARLAPVSREQRVGQ